MNLSKFAVAAALLAVPVVSSASVVYYDNIGLVTSPNPNGGNSNGTGVWFNPLTGYAESRGSLFPTPLFEDGKFFLVMDTSFAQTEAEIYTQGFFSRGNGVIYESNVNLNPKRFAAGQTIGAGVGYQNPGAGFTDLGPTFGNWAAGGQGYVGLTIRDASGATASDIFYGYADIDINPTTFAIKLNAFAYENVRGASITAGDVPEPTALASLAVVGLCLGRRRRRRG